MLESLFSVVNFIKATFYFGFYLSYKAGYFLVTSINTIFKYSVVLFDNLISFFTALGESLAIFIQDIFQCIQQTLLLITTAVEIISWSVTTVFLKISLFISSVAAVGSSIYNGLVNGIAAITASIGHTTAFLKNVVILFGSGVWFLITLVPFLLYYLCLLSISFIHTIYQETCDICHSGLLNVKALIKGIVLFIFDVPIESIAGLIIALCLIYILTQFYVLVISYFKQQLRKVRMWIRHHWQGTEIFSYFNTFSRQHTRRQPIRTPEARQPVRGPVHIRQLVQARTSVRTQPTVRERQEKSLLWEDKFCVICQERNKCVLLLPCKHLCLCTECTRELRFYNEVCPICRTNIESTMKIFV